MTHFRLCSATTARSTCRLYFWALHILSNKIDDNEGIGLKRGICPCVRNWNWEIISCYNHWMKLTFDKLKPYRLLIAVNSISSSELTLASLQTLEVCTNCHQRHWLWICDALNNLWNNSYSLVWCIKKPQKRIYECRTFNLSFSQLPYTGVLTQQQRL